MFNTKTSLELIIGLENFLNVAKITQNKLQFYHDYAIMQIEIKFDNYQFFNASTFASIEVKFDTITIPKNYQNILIYRTALLTTLVSSIYTVNDSPSA